MPVYFPHLDKELKSRYRSMVILVGTNLHESFGTRKSWVKTKLRFPRFYGGEREKAPRKEERDWTEEKWEGVGEEGVEEEEGVGEGEEEEEFEKYENKK